METVKNYFTMAESDYQYLKEDYERGKFGNVLCYCSQNICERYLKHVIDVYVRDVNTTEVLRTHNLKNLRGFIKNALPDFKANWSIILMADGYYFAARYPGSEASFTTAEDASDCQQAVEETRRAVIEYVQAHPVNSKPVKIDAFK